MALHTKLCCDISHCSCYVISILSSSTLVTFGLLLRAIWRRVYWSMNENNQAELAEIHLLTWTVPPLVIVVALQKNAHLKKNQPARHQMRLLRSIVRADIAHPSHCSSRLCPHFSLNSCSLHISWPHSRYLCSDFYSDSLGSIFIFSALEGVICNSSVPFLWELRCPLKSFICSAVGSHSCTWSCLQSTREPQGPHLCAQK